jgi:NAD(P)-dependent dehydrogenase (short-subunit alcohol dehydrogenase family)
MPQARATGSLRGWFIRPVFAYRYALPSTGRLAMSERRTALVTGASSGLGAAMTVRLAERGWTVFAASRSGKVPANRAEIVPLSMDVSATPSVEAGIRGMLAQAGRVDLVINNAGINFPGPAEEIPLDNGIELLQTNLLGVVRVTNAVLPHMRACRSGTILTIGSLAALVAPPGEAYYAASKSGLEGFLESLRYEVQTFGIRILLAEPGFIRTGFAEHAPDFPPLFADYDAIRAALARHWKTAIASGMPADEMARRIVAWAERPGGALRRRFGRDARTIPVLKRLMPERAFFAVTRRIFGI